MREARVWFNTFDADVWAVETEVRGGFGNLPSGSSLFVALNSTPIPHTVGEGGTFAAVCRLQAGKNEVTAGYLEPNGTPIEEARITLVNKVPCRPKAVIAVEISGDSIKLSGSGSAPNEVTGAPVAVWQWRPEDVPEALRLVDGREFTECVGPAVEIAAPETDGEYYISLTVKDHDGFADRAVTYFVVEDGKARTVNWTTENPRWVDNAMVYGVVPHNFGPHGFRSVTEKLDYLKELGINAIWLAPSNATPTESGHSYNVSGYFELRPDYGTKAEFAELVAEAHRRGIRVLMDVVPNHSAYEHPYFQHALQHGKASPYYDFYDRDEQGNYTYYFNWTHLPNLNYDNPQVRRWMAEALSYWIREFDVDGYRVDAIWGVKQRRPDFWPEMRAELQRIKPDILLIAEASARDPYYVQQGFDAAYDWTDELGHWAWENVFEEPTGIAQRLHAALTNDGKGYGPDSLIFRFLNNNDTGPRFLTRYGAELKRVAATLVWTLDGIPCLYTGEENGIEFEPYQTPDPIDFTDKGFREYYRQLIDIRTANPALRSRDTMLLGPEGEAYGYVRRSKCGQTVLVLLNFSGQEQVYHLQGAGAVLQEKRGKELLTGREIEPTIRVVLAPWEALIIALD